MVAIKLFLANEVHRDIVFVEVVRHLDDLLLHRLGICALLEHHPALAGVLLTRGQLRVAAGAHRLERGGHGDGVLARIGHAGDAAQRVGVSLGNAAAPEGVVRTLRQDAVGVQAVQREQARIPTAGDERAGAGVAGRRVDVREVRGDVGMRVERVHHVVQRRVLRRLLGQVGGAAAAQDEHVDVLVAGLKIGHGTNGHALGGDAHACGVATRVHRRQLHVVVLANSQLNATSQVSVSQNADASHFASFPNAAARGRVRASKNASMIRVSRAEPASAAQFPHTKRIGKRQQSRSRHDSKPARGTTAKPARSATAIPRATPPRRVRHVNRSGYILPGPFPSC